MTDRKVIGTCPHCGNEIVSRDKGWFCTNRECRFVIWKDNAFFKRLSKHPTEQFVKRLVTDGQIKLKDCRNPEKGRPYDATVFLALENDGRPKFSLTFENRGNK